MVVGDDGGVPSDYFVSTQLQLWLFCCWGCGCRWAVTIGLKSPLVQIMQSNEKKISENLKVHRDKYLLKKLKRREKEAKSNSERKRVKKEQNYRDFLTKLSLKRSMIPVGKLSKM